MSFLRIVFYRNVMRYMAEMPEIPAAGRPDHECLFDTLLAESYERVATKTGLEALESPVVATMAHVVLQVFAIVSAVTLPMVTSFGAFIKEQRSLALARSCLGEKLK